MPAYYWIEFYVDLEDTTIDNVIQEAIDGLQNAGCRFKEIKIVRAQDDAGDHRRQVPIVEQKTIELSEAKEFVVKDLDGRARGLSKDKLFPLPTLIFEFGFKFDGPVRKKMSDSRFGKINPDEVTLRFSYQDSSETGRGITVLVHTWEEYVLMYGDKETHVSNMSAILRIAESVYDYIKPYFGWMDGEMGSNDHSFDLLIKGEIPAGNDFVFVGNKIKGKLNIDALKRSNHPWKFLQDGGVIIQKLVNSQWVTAHKNYLSDQ